MKNSSKILTVIAAVGVFYYFYRGKPSVPPHITKTATTEKGLNRNAAPTAIEHQGTPAAPMMKLHPVQRNIETTAADSEPTPEGDPSVPDTEHNPDQVKVEALTDSEMEGHLNEKISADARIQRVADILAVNCQAGTCVIRAQAKPDLEQEVQMAFILFQKEHPEFGSNFRMEPNPDDPAINNFVYTKEKIQPATATGTTGEPGPVTR